MGNPRRSVLPTLLFLCFSQSDKDFFFFFGGESDKDLNVMLEL